MNSDSNGFQLSQCLRHDLLRVANCHQRAFPKSFSTQLGLSYLIKNFEWYIASENSFLIKVEIKNKVVGYCGGMLIDNKTTKGSTSSIMQYTFKAAILALAKKPWLCLNKEVRGNINLILKNIVAKLGFFKKELNRPKAHSASRKISLGLVVIGTLPENRGQGLGYRLLTQFEQEARKRNAEQLHLSVKKSNVDAIRSYSRSGWKIKNESKENYEMIKPLIND